MNKRTNNQKSNKSIKEENKGQKNVFKERLKKLIDDYVQFIYKISAKFPREEMFGATSQIRRAALSVILNYIEGFARRKLAVQLNFFETSYGSLRESRYLVYFGYRQKWITEEEYSEGIKRAEEMGAMLWTELQNLDKYINE